MENNNQQAINMALALLIQGVDQAIEKSPFNRKQIVDLDWAIKTLTGENKLPQNGKQEGKKELAPEGEKK